MNEIIDKLSPEEIRSGICQFEDIIKNTDGSFIGDNPAVAPLTHIITDGLYVREIFLPKGLLCVGKIHKHPHPNFLMSGDVTVITESEGEQRLVAPFWTISPAGTKRLVYANEDSIWITVHANPDNETDLEVLEDKIISKSFKELSQNDWKELI